MMKRLALVVIASALVLAGCSGNVGPDRPAPESQESTQATQAVPPNPGLDAPGTSSQGRVGEAASIGGWTVLVREAEFVDDEEFDDGTSGSGLKVEIDLSHNRDTAQRVTSGDWTLVSVDGDTFEPRSMSDPEEQGTRTIGPNETEDVKLFFDVPPGEAYVLRFEPALAGAAALNIAVP